MFRDSELSLLNEDQVRIRSEIHPIQFGKPEELTPGFIFRPYAFSDVLRQQADGCVFQMDPWCSTRPALIEENSRCLEIPINGSGYFLGVSPEGVLVKRRFDSTNRGLMVEYEKGWFLAWVAEQRGMSVLNLNYPPFTDDMEVIAEMDATHVNGTVIPGEFWREYHELIVPRNICGQGLILLNDNRVFVDGQIFHLKSLGREPTEKGYGYAVEPYQIEGNKNMDVAKATIFPNRWIPPELVLRDGIADYLIRGKGEGIVFSPDRGMRRFYFEEANSWQGNTRITYRKGDYICWRAYSAGLEFVEVCTPPYKPGDLEILDIENPKIPPAFREAYLEFTQQQK